MGVLVEGDYRIVVVGGNTGVTQLEAFAMHIKGGNRTGRADEENGVDDCL